MRIIYIYTIDKKSIDFKCNNNIPFCLRESDNIPTIIERILYEDIKKYNLDLSDSGIKIIEKGDIINILLNVINCDDANCYLEIKQDLNDALKIFKQ